MQEFYDIFFPLQFTSILSRWIILTAAVFVAALLYGISSLLHHRALHPKVPRASTTRKSEKALSASLLLESDEEFGEEELQDDILTQEDEEMIEEEMIEEDIVEEHEELLQVTDGEQENEREETPGEFQNEKPSVWFGISRLSWLLFWKKPKKNGIDSDSSEFETQEDVSEYDDMDGGDESQEVLSDEQETQDEETQTIVVSDENPSEILMTEEVVDINEQKSRDSLHRENLQSELERLGKKKQRDIYEEKLISGLSQDPHHSGILEYLADFYMSQELTKKALPLYKKLVDKEAENHSFLWKMAKAYRTLGDEEMAEVLLKRALSLHPRTPKYATDLVELYYERNNPSQAISLMEEVVQRRPENMGYRKVLIYFYEEKEEYNKIVESYESMLVVNPTDMTIKRKLLEARSKLQR